MRNRTSAGRDVHIFLAERRILVWLPVPPLVQADLHQNLIQPDKGEIIGFNQQIPIVAC